MADSDWQILKYKPKATGDWEILREEKPVPGMEKLGALPGPAQPRTDVQPAGILTPLKQAAMSGASALGEAGRTLGNAAFTSVLPVPPSQMYDSGVEALKDAGEKYVKPIVDTVAGGGTYSSLKAQTGPMVEAANKFPQTAMGAADFLSTPAGAATLAAGPALEAASPYIRAAAPAAFSASMTPGAIEAAKEAYHDPTPANVVGAGLQAAMVAAPLVHPAIEALKAKEAPGAPIIDTSQPETVRRPATTEGLQRVAQIEANPAKRALLKKQAAEEGVALPEPPAATSPAAESASALESHPDYVGLFDQADARDGWKILPATPEEAPVPIRQNPAAIRRGTKPQPETPVGVAPTNATGSLPGRAAPPTATPARSIVPEPIIQEEKANEPLPVRRDAIDAATNQGEPPQAPSGQEDQPAPGRQAAEAQTVSQAPVEPPVEIPAPNEQPANVPVEPPVTEEPPSAPPVRPDSERGSFSLKPVAPLSPSEQYAEELAAKREEARKAPGLMDKAKGLYVEAKNKIVDYNAAIEDPLAASQKKYGYEILPQYNISHNIDLSLRAKTLAGQFATDHGIADAIEKVDNPEYFGQYLTAQQAAAATSRGIETGRDLAKDQALLKEFRNREAIPASDGKPAVTYPELAQKVNDYSRALLDYAVDAGMVSPDLATKLKEIYPNYVPMKRVFEIAAEETGPATGKGNASLSAQHLVQRLKGSEREIENPLESILSQTDVAIAEGERNKAARQLADYRNLPGFEDIKEVTGQPGKHPNTFSYLDGGAKRTFEAPAGMAAAAKALNVQQLNILGKILATPVRIAKVGITGANPAFALANLVRDQQTAAINSQFSRQTSVLNPKIFMKALVGAIGHGDLYQEMVRSGAGGTSFDIARNAPAMTVARIRADRSMGSKLAYTVRHPSELLRAAEDIIGRSEEMTRLQVYEGTKQALLKEGRTPEDANILAAMAARNRTANFSRRGEWGTVLNSAWLYLNAGIQGSRSHIQALQERPAATSFKIAANILLPVATITAWNLSDPKRAAAYKDVKEFEKDNSLILMPEEPIKDERGRWNVIKMPLPQGVSQLGVPIRRMVEQLYGGNPVGFGEVAKALVSSVSPVDPDKNKIASSVTPQIMRPSLENYSNRDFFRDTPIVPDNLAQLPVEEQSKPYTSGTARLIGKKTGTSPLKVEHMVTGTLGGLGGQGLHYVDKGLAAAGVIPGDQVGGDSIPSAMAARFKKAQGGQEVQNALAELKPLEEQHASKVASAKRSAHSIHDELQRMQDPEEKRQYLTKLAEDGTLDDAMANEIMRIQKQGESKLAPFEKVLVRRPVEVRAQYAIKQLQGKTPDQKRTMLLDWAERGVINDRVADEIANQLSPQAQAAAQ